jgi:AraC family transcriptional regulator
MDSETRVELTQLPEMTLIGHSFRTSPAAQRQPGEIPAFWDDFFHSGRHGRLPEAAIPGVLVACCYDEGEDGSFSYLIGAPVRADQQPSGDQERLELPAARYARATARGLMAQAIPATFQWLHRQWLPSSGLEPASGPELEWYDHRVSCGADAEVDLFVPVR